MSAPCGPAPPSCSGRSGRRRGRCSAARLRPTTSSGARRRASAAIDAARPASVSTARIASAEGGRDRAWGTTMPAPLAEQLDGMRERRSRPPGARRRRRRRARPRSPGPSESYGSTTRSAERIELGERGEVPVGVVERHRLVAPARSRHGARASRGTPHPSVRAPSGGSAPAMTYDGRGRRSPSRGDGVDRPLDALARAEQAPGE